jgi:hypothetical protein
MVLNLPLEDKKQKAGGKRGEGRGKLTARWFLTTNELLITMQLIIDIEY